MQHEERARSECDAMDVGLCAGSEISRGMPDLEQRTRELSLLTEVAGLLASSIDFDTLLERIFSKALKVVGTADLVALFLHDPSSDCLVLRCARGRTSAACRTQLASGETVVGRSFAACRTVICPTGSDITTSKTDWLVLNGEPLPDSNDRLPRDRWEIATPLVYRDRTVGVLFLESRLNPAVLGDLHISLIRALADQLAVAIENHRMGDVLRAKEEIRSRLLDKLISAQEGERRRIARELHDETSQALTAVIISLESAEESLPIDLNEVRQRLAAVRGLTVETLEEIRKIITDLRPTLLDDLGLIPALRWYSKTQSDRLGLGLTFGAKGFEGRLPPQVETVLFRVVQEGITNIARHAKANSMSVRLEKNGSTVIAAIEDDGRGFHVGEHLGPTGSRGGFGLHGIKERANLLGGTLVIDSAPGRGTRLIVTVSVPREQGEMD